MCIWIRHFEILYRWYSAVNTPLFLSVWQPSILWRVTFWFKWWEGGTLFSCGIPVFVFPTLNLRFLPVPKGWPNPTVDEDGTQSWFVPAEKRRLLIFGSGSFEIIFFGADRTATACVSFLWIYIYYDKNSICIFFYFHPATGSVVCLLAVWLSKLSPPGFPFNLLE